MTARPTVGVVIPTHNRRALLAATLDSLTAQTRPPDRVVVVADGCTDGTVDALHDRPGVAVLATPGLGAAAARNAGWRALGTDLMAFLDDDCRAEPRWLEELVGGFAGDDVGLVQGRTMPAGEVGPFDRTVWVTEETGLYESCNIAYRRVALERVGGMREEFGRGFAQRRGSPATGGGSGFGEDTDLAWRVMRSGWRPAFAPGAVVRHAVFPGSAATMLAEAWRASAFPFLVREIPELRDRLPGGRWLLRKQSAAAQLALAGVAGGLLACAAGRRPVAAALGAPYLVWLSRQTRRPGAAARLAARDAVTSAALLTGSVRHRSILL